MIVNVTAVKGKLICGSRQCEEDDKNTAGGTSGEGRECETMLGYFYSQKLIELIFLWGRGFCVLFRRLRRDEFIVVFYVLEGVLKRGGSLYFLDFCRSNSRLG